MVIIRDLVVSPWGVGENDFFYLVFPRIACSAFLTLWAFHTYSGSPAGKEAGGRGRVWRESEHHPHPLHIQFVSNCDGKVPRRSKWICFLKMPFKKCYSAFLLDVQRLSAAGVLQQVVLGDLGLP